LATGGYSGEGRRGQHVFHPLPALSIGCVIVEAGNFASHHEVSAALSEVKKEAKRIPGSALFVERRQHDTGIPPAETKPQIDAVSPAPSFSTARLCPSM
ncbi:MAG: hypothetical protein K9J74_01665, partial [Sulfuritalea sp.]|nr:hypothetical protein [Sulfuritalea sp.]